MVGLAPFTLLAKKSYPASLLFSLAPVGWLVCSFPNRLLHAAATLSSCLRFAFAAPD
jgi:hypothetical protein